MSNVEDSVRSFYDTKGWSGGEDALFRQFRPAYRKYHASTTERTIGCFAGKHGSLLIVGDGDLPQSHVSIATQFEQTACVDISKAALDISEKSCRKRGRFSDQLLPPRVKEFAVRLHLRCPRHLSYRRADAGEGLPRDDPAGEAGRSQ